MPTTNRKWLREIERAYQKAVLRVEKESLSIENVYKLAAHFAGTRRGIDTSLIQEAEAENQINIEDQRKRGNPGEWVFEFYSCYLDAHVHYGFLDDMAVDEILEYVTHEGDIFLNDYEDEFDV